MKQTTKETQIGSSKAAQPPELGAAMVDALEDILRWERASERKLKAEKVTNEDTALSA